MKRRWFGRVFVALDVAILILASTAAYFYVTSGYHGFWTVFSLVAQMFIFAAAVYRLSRTYRRRTPRS